MRLDPEILDRSPSEGARVVALALCGDAEEAARRLEGPADERALREFREVLRRLRSTLRALRPLLGSAVRPADRADLAGLARATGPARDARALAAWLGEVRPDLHERYRPALDWLLGRVEGARHEANGQVEARVAPAFTELAPALAQGLAAGGAVPQAAETFGAALAGLLRAQLRSLREALSGIGAPGDSAPAHRACIEARRLGHLLEPLRGNARADAAGAAKALRGLRDLLDELDDAHRAQAEVAAALVVAAAERARRTAEDEPPDLRPGLLAVERAAAGRVEGLFGRLREEWLEGGATAALDEAFAVVAALEWRDAEEAQPERRLLLTALPAEAGQLVEEVEQGWLPGERARESVGRSRGPAGERCFRSTAQGKGAGRFEAVEEIPAEAFEAYWPLTEGRRVHRRRHAPGASAPGLCFDDYPGRRVVVAIAAEGAELPPWLEPLVVRDVTGERGYGDEALARKPVRG